MNNRKQKVFSTLDSLTQKELSEYVQDRNLNNNFKDLLEKVAQHRKRTFGEKCSAKIAEDFNKAISSYYKVGQAWIIAFCLECFYDNKYKIADLKYYLKQIIENDSELKEYVYELMKDF